MAFRFPEFSFNPTGRLEPLTPHDRDAGAGADAGARVAEHNPQRGWGGIMRRAAEAPKKFAPQFSARIFVGFNVGREPVWTVNDVKAQAYFLRIEMKADPSLSVWAGEGIFKSRKQLVSEESVQILILDFGKDWDKFAKPMVPYAGTLARRLLQESVALQLNDKGVSHFSEMIPSGLSKAEMDPVRNFRHIQRVQAETEVFLDMF
jgi:hypothetical protein